MKVFLMDNASLDKFLLMKYLEVKGLPFWVYVYDSENDRMEKVTNHTDALLSNAEYTLYKEDLGDYVDSDDESIPDDIEYNYYYDEMDAIRTDPDLIQVYEKYAKQMMGWLRVVEVPEHEEFAVVHVIDTCGQIWEKLVLKSGMNWMKAK